MDVKEINNQKFRLPSESDRNSAKEQITKLRKEGEKMIKGMFEFTEAQGGWLDFSYRFFPGEPLRTVRITHGEITDVPRVLVKHLNNCYKKVRTPPDDLDKGKTNVMKVSRCRFTPMDVM